MPCISYGTSRKCNRFFSRRRSKGALLARMGQLPGNSRGDFQHPPGLLVCAMACIVKAVMNELLEEEETQVQPTSFLARSEKVLEEVK